MEVGLLSLGGVYKATDWEATAKLGMHSWNLSYLHKVQSIKVILVTIERRGVDFAITFLGFNVRYRVRR